MTKYYRVRTPEQWDWLMEHLELEYPFSSTTFLTDSIFMDLKDDQQLVPKISIKSSNINKIIEVSKLMEDEKMKYVTIKENDLGKINDQNGPLFGFDFNTDKYFIDGDLKKIKIPTSLLYRKVKMAKAEKAEFDKLNKEWTTLYLAISAINDEFLEYPLLNNRLFIRMTSAEENEAQIEFARAWADPSLIEVIPEKKWNVKVPPFERTSRYYYKHGGELGGADSFGNDDEDQQFTDSELKEYGLDDDMFEKIEVTDDGTK